MGEAVADGASRHRLEPEPLDGLLRLGVLDDVAENQFAFAPGVAGVNQTGDVLSLEQFGENLEATRALLDGSQGEVRRDDGQIGERPLAFLGFELLRAAQFQQMADR